MPYGGMPHDALLSKLEETDRELVAEVRGDDPFFDTEDYYNEYVRAEIIDRTPDSTFLESDHPRRDPALSRTVLNLRHAGGRGPNDYRLPQHPELFLGFTGNDPRGADTPPRLDKSRAQMAARARGREVRMGHNIGHGDFVEADRPWSGTAREYDKKEIQRRLKGYMHWFPTQKEGRPWGRNTVADEFYGLRRATVRDGGEGLYVPEQDQPAEAISAGWLQQKACDPVLGAETDGVRRVTRAASGAPWRNTTGDAGFAVQRYAATARGVAKLWAGGGRGRPRGCDPGRANLRSPPVRLRPRGRPSGCGGGHERRGFHRRARARAAAATPITTGRPRPSARAAAPRSPGRTPAPAQPPATPITTGRPRPCARAGAPRSDGRTPAPA